MPDVKCLEMSTTLMLIILEDFRKVTWYPYCSLSRVLCKSFDACTGRLNDNRHAHAQHLLNAHQAQISSNLNPSTAWWYLSIWWNHRVWLWFWGEPYDLIWHSIQPGLIGAWTVTNCAIVMPCILDMDPWRVEEKCMRAWNLRRPKGRHWQSRVLREIRVGASNGLLLFKLEFLTLQSSTWPSKLRLHSLS